MAAKLSLIRAWTAIATRFQSQVLRNLVALYGAQAANFVFPVLLIPFLARALGPVAWGQYAIAESYARVVNVLIEFGLHLSGTRRVSRLRDDPAARGKLIVAAISAQALMAGAWIAITAVLCLVLPQFHGSGRLIASGLFWAVTQAMGLLWYFQGIQRVQEIVSIDVAAKGMAIVLILSVVRVPGDAWLVFLFQGMASLIVTAWGVWLAGREAPYRWPQAQASISILREGLSIFWCKAAVLLYSSANPLLLSFLAPPEFVGCYAGAEKICRAAVNTLHPINQAFYPRLAALLAADRRRAALLARQVCAAMLLYGLGLTALLAGANQFLVKTLLGGQYGQAAVSLSILSLIPPVNAVGNALGLQWMIGLGLDRLYLRIIVLCGLLNLLLLTLLAPLWGLVGIAWAVVATELAAAIGVVAVLRHRAQLPYFEFNRKAAAELENNDVLTDVA